MNRLIKKYLKEFKADNRSQKGFVSVIIGNCEQIYYYKNSRKIDHFFTDVAKVYKSGKAMYKEGLEYHAMGGYTYSILIDFDSKGYWKSSWNIDGMHRLCLNLTEYLRKNEKLKHIKKFDCLCKNNNPFEIEKFYERHAIDLERAEKSGSELADIVKNNPILMNFSSNNKMLALKLIAKYKTDLVSGGGFVDIKLLRRVMKTALSPKDLCEMDELKLILDKSDEPCTIEKAKKILKYFKTQDNITSYLVDIYFDYKNICNQLGEEFIEFPKDLVKRHDDLKAAWKIKKDAFMNDEIKVQYEKYIASLKLKHYSLSPLDSVEKLVKTGNEFHNCVATYVNRIFDKKYLIYLVNKDNVPYACLGIKLGDEPILEQLYLDNNEMLEEKEYNAIRRNLLIRERNNHNEILQM